MVDHDQELTEEEEEHNHFTDTREGRSLISELKEYFKLFSELEQITTKHVIEAFSNNVGPMIKELEELSSD